MDDNWFNLVDAHPYLNSFNLGKMSPSYNNLNEPSIDFYEPSEVFRKLVCDGYSLYDFEVKANFDMNNYYTTYLQLWTTIRESLWYE